MLSVVIPIFDEEDIIEELLRRTFSSLEKVNIENEVIIVNDGSKDNTLSILKDSMSTYPHLRIVNLSRNFGHQSALMAGISQAKGDAIILMDGDLQDPPEIFNQMVEKWNEGFDVIIAARKNRKEGIFRRILFNIFYKAFAFMSDYPMSFDSGIFGLISRRVADNLIKLEERNRFIPGLRNWIGFPSSVVWYTREDRAGGEPKQNLIRLLKYGADAIFSFSYKPLRVSLILGAFISFISFSYAFILILMRLLEINYVKGFTTGPVAIFFLGGIMLISNGIMGEYLGRIYDEVKRRPHFIIQDIFSLESKDDSSTLS